MCSIHCGVDRLAMAGQVAPVTFVQEAQLRFDAATKTQCRELDGCEGAPP